MRLSVYVSTFGKVIDALGENVEKIIFGWNASLDILSLKASRMLRDFLSASDFSLKRFVYVAFSVLILLHCGRGNIRSLEMRQINYSANRLMTPNRVLFMKVNLPHFHNYLHSIFHFAAKIYRNAGHESPGWFFFVSLSPARSVLASRDVEKLKKSLLT